MTNQILTTDCKIHRTTVHLGGRVKKRTSFTSTDIQNAMRTVRMGFQCHHTKTIKHEKTNNFVTLKA